MQVKCTLQWNVQTSIDLYKPRVESLYWLFLFPKSTTTQNVVNMRYNSLSRPTVLQINRKTKQLRQQPSNCCSPVDCMIGLIRMVGVRLHEHKTELESKTKRAFTRSQRTASLTEYILYNSKSALTDHANQGNHTIDWKRLRSSTENKTVLPGGSRKFIEGSYQLSHAYDRFLDATADRRIKTRKN